MTARTQPKWMAAFGPGLGMGRGIRLGVGLGVGLGLALATGLTAPANAQETAQETATPGAAAEARLDFTAALDELSAAIEADPTAPRPRLARADLHVKMQRPALALADLEAVLAEDPANLAALSARVDIWNKQRAWGRARADLDTALAADPGNAEVLALRAQVNQSAGLTAAALADYEAALVAAPDNAGIARARDTLRAGVDERRAASVVFDAEAVMSDEFRVEQGDAAAPNTLYIIHAATDLAEDLAAIDPALIARAVDEGALRVIHLFTYTGDDASIWGNLALICAGPKGYTATHAALSDAPGREALTAAGTGEFAPLERLLTAAYSVAGIDKRLVHSCALDRSRATRYLADWQSHRDATAWRGANMLDTWPAWVLNGTSLAPPALATRLAELAPATEALPETVPDSAPGSAPETLPDEAPATATGEADVAQAATSETEQPAVGPTKKDAQSPEMPPVAETRQTAPPPAPAPAAERVTEPAPSPGAAEAATADGPSQAKPAPEAPLEMQTPGTATLAPVRFPNRPQPVDDARVPVDLRGIYAPSLAGCLGYLDAIEDPSRIDAVLPEMNALDGPALGTILVTSRRVYLFNPLDTECAISGANGSDAGWAGSFACASPLEPDAAPVLQLAPATADGTAPRVSATFAGAAPETLRQCRTLGQLGNAFAPLWDRNGSACTVAVPVENGRFAFSVDADDNLILRLAPTAILPEAGRALPRAAIDGAPFGEAPGRWDGTGWQVSLGPFKAAAERLGWGMFLDLRTTGDIFEARLPLFGSSAAMKTLAACAPARD